MSKSATSIFFRSSSSSSYSSLSSIVALLVILALALSPTTMMAFTITRTSGAGLLPLRRLATFRGAMKRWETTGKIRADTMGLPCSSSNSDSDPTATMAGWTVREALDESMRRLTDKNVTEPDYSALYLMAASLELPWERGIRDLEGRSDRHQSTRLTAEQAIDLEAKLKRREDHEPIQYVLGQWDFLDYTIAIRKPLLCPRPETEELVLKVVEETTESPVHILDVGCGTGVIGISLAELLPDATVEAIDVEPVAIETSMENAQRVLKDQAGGIDKYPDCYKATLVSASEYTPEFPFDVVVSNPPYIPRSDMEGLSEDVTQHESDIALCGGTDGMDVIYTIIERLPEWCNTDAVCWMEVDPSHPKLIEEFLSKSASEEETGSGRRKKNKKSMFSGRSVRFESSHKDMFGKDRFVKLRVV